MHSKPLFPRLSVVLTAGLISLSAYAQQPSAPIEASVRGLLQNELHGLPGRVEVLVGPFDSNNQLPRCDALAPFLPPGVRAWGRFNVGVSCSQPSSWTVYVPAQVKVYGNFLVSARNLRAGQTLDNADLASRYGDVAALAGDPIMDAAQAVGMRTRYSIMAGQPLRSEMLIMPQAVQQGDEVKLLIRGQGFEVSNKGRAMNNANDGQNVRVRLSDGRVLNGTARTGGIVEIDN